MRFGLTTPIVTLAPRTHAAWERTAGPEEIRAIAQCADRLGYHHLSCSEHVAIPTTAVATRGGRYYDPAATLGFVAALTSRIRLLTHVVVLPYHHPLTIAKRYGTLDRLSAGRVILGVGVGSLEEEFRLLGIDFAGRGERYEDALRALRASLSREDPSYNGPHYDFSGFRVDPCAVQEHLPMWIGGRSPRSLRRALEFADGWNPFGFRWEQLQSLLNRARTWPQWETRAAAFDLALSPEEPLRLDEPADVEAARDLVERYRCIGATVLNLRFQHRSLPHLLDLLQRFAEEIMPDVKGAEGI
jgi:probable F420-dependent oxidoreductase